MSEFLLRFTVLGHKPIKGTGTHGNRIACASCKVHAVSKYFRHVLELGRCQVIAISSSAYRPSVPCGSSGLAVAGPSQTSTGPILKRPASSQLEAAPAVAHLRVSQEVATFSAAPQLLEQPPLVGQRRLHPSHRLEHRRGVILCTQCGFFSASKARELFRECTKTRSKNTRNNVVRWLEGLPPKHNMVWPETNNNLPSGLIWRPS